MSWKNWKKKGKEVLKEFSKEEKRIFKVTGCLWSLLLFMYVIVSIITLEGIRLPNYIYLIPPVIILSLLYYFQRMIEQLDLTQFGENQFRKLLKSLKLLIVSILILDVIFVIKWYGKFIH